MNGARAIFLKELRDLVRDRRVRNSAFLGPFITVSILLFAFGTLLSSIGKPSGQKVAFVARPGSEAIQAAFKASGIQVTTYPTLDAGKAAIRNGDARLLLDTGPDVAARSAAGHPVTLDEYKNPSDDAADITSAFVQKQIDAANLATVRAVFKAKGVDPGLAQPMRIKTHEVTQAGGGSSQILIGFIPYLLVLWSFYGGLGAVNDMAAGEKEKNTLETLLITPASRRGIAVGKLGALAVLCLCSSLSSLVALVACYLLHLKSMAPLFANGLGISGFGLFRIVLVLIPNVLLVASLTLAVSTRARNVRESQTQLTLVSFLFLMPAICSQFIGYTAFARSLWISAVPVLDTAVAIRQALSGEWHPAATFLTIGVNLALGCATLAYAVSLFKREDVLMRI